MRECRNGGGSPDSSSGPGVLGGFKTYSVTREVDGASFDIDEATITPLMETTEAGFND
jgi:hypothetical protein